MSEKELETVETPEPTLKDKTVNFINNHKKLLVGVAIGAAAAVITCITTSKSDEDYSDRDWSQYDDEPQSETPDED